MAYNFKSKIITDGLLIYLDGAKKSSYATASNTWYDISKKNNNASIINNPLYIDNYYGGVSFKNNSKYLELIFPPTGNEITVSQWIRAINTTAYTFNVVDNIDSNISIFSRVFYTGNIYKHQCLISGYPFGFPQEMNIYINTDINTFITNNLPYNYTFTFKRTNGVWSNLRAYINGKLVENLYNSNDFFKNTAMFGTTKYSIGQTSIVDMFSLQVYNRALTQAEVTQNFNAHRGRYGI